MSESERTATLQDRKARRQPWHSPPHRESICGRYLITSACYQHAPIIGVHFKRLDAFETELLGVCREFASIMWAWTILPNHYHVLLEAPAVLELLRAIGQLHGRTSYLWNGEDSARGRKVWHGALETAMKSDRHFRATINYIHNNPVKHGYVDRWQDWPFGNAGEYLDAVGHYEAERVWKQYPVG